MDLEKYQHEVHAWVQQFKNPYWPFENMYCQLVEEVGEAARALNAMHGPRTAKAGENNDLGEELADILFTCCCMANPPEISLTDVSHIYIPTVTHEPIATIMEMDVEKGKLGFDWLHGRGSRGHVGKRLGRIVNHCVRLADMHGIDLDAEFRKTMETKHYGRDNDRYARKS